MWAQSFLFSSFWKLRARNFFYRETSQTSPKLNIGPAIVRKTLSFAEIFVVEDKGRNPRILILWDSYNVASRGDKRDPINAK